MAKEEKQKQLTNLTDEQKIDKIREIKGELESLFEDNNYFVVFWAMVAFEKDLYCEVHELDKMKKVFDKYMDSDLSNLLNPEVEAIIDSELEL